MSDEQDKRLREALRGLQPPPSGADARERVRAAVAAAAADAAAERAAAAPAAAEHRRRAGAPSRSSPGTAGWRSASRLSPPSPSSPASSSSVCREAAGPSRSAPARSCSAPCARSRPAARSPPRSRSGLPKTTTLDAPGRYDVDRYRFLLRADGSYRLTRRGPSRFGWSPTGGSHPPAEVVFDARRGVLSTYSRRQGLIERFGYPLGPPRPLGGHRHAGRFQRGRRARSRPPALPG